MFDAGTDRVIKLAKELAKLREARKMTEAERLYKMKSQCALDNAREEYNLKIKPLLEKSAKLGNDYFDYTEYIDINMVRYLNSVGFTVETICNSTRISWAPVARDYLE